MQFRSIPKDVFAQCFKAINIRDIEPSDQRIFGPACGSHFYNLTDLLLLKYFLFLKMTLNVKYAVG